MEILAHSVTLTHSHRLLKSLKTRAEVIKKIEWKERKSKRQMKKGPLPLPASVIMP